MPREGPAYPISKTWRAEVRKAIDALRDDNDKPLSDAAFARLAKISKASLSEALNDASIQTTIMPAIHAALGWPEPQLVIAPDQLELLAQYDAMSEFERGRALERARSTVERLRRENTGRSKK